MKKRIYQVLFALFLFLSSNLFGANSKVEIFGISTAYNYIELETTDGSIYTKKNQYIQIGSFYYVKDESVNLGGGSFPSGTAKSETAKPIRVGVAGIYNITFDIITGDYIFELVGEPYKSIIQLDGSSLDFETVSMKTEDQENYTLKNQLLKTGLLIFKLDSYNYTYWASDEFPNGIGGINNNKNIAINQGGYYDISFNIKTGAYSFSLVEKIHLRIGAMGTSIEDSSIVEFETNDGENYLISGQKLIEGSLNFQNLDNIYSEYWGAMDFPIGKANINGEDIQVKLGGIYDIHFNLNTGDYRFELIGEPIYEDIYLYGTAVFGNKIKLDTKDGIIYTLNNQRINEGELEFQNEGFFFNDSWGSKDFPKGIAQLNNGAMIAYIKGDFNVVFNKKTFEYEFIIIGNPIPSNLVIENIQSSDIYAYPLSTTDGINYYINNQVFYEGEISMSQENAGKWDFLNSLEGKAEINSSTIFRLSKSARYDYKFNIITKQYSFEISKSFDPSIGIYGNATKNEEIKLSSKDGIVYSLKSQYLSTGDLVFRQDSTYELSWSGNDFIKGIAKFLAGYLSIPKEGYYDITFNLKTLEYEFTLVKTATQPIIKLGGYAVIGDNTTLETTDGINYALLNIPLVLGHVEFTDELGNYKGEPKSIPSGKIYYSDYGGEQNINDRGIYNITLNRLTEEYTFNKIADLSQVIYMYGNALTGTKSMNTTDGVVYTLKEQNLKLGNIIFQNDEIDVMVFWGSKDFPIGKVQKYYVDIDPQDMIQINKPGYYNITLNIGNNTMSFQETTLSTSNFQENTKFSVYPNPVTDGKLFLSEVSDVTLYDLSGRLILQQNQVNSVDVSTLGQGQYILKTSDGNTTKVIVK